MSDPESLRERVAKALAERVAPALHMDGADLEVVDVAGGEVRVRVRGGCFG